MRARRMRSLLAPLEFTALREFYNIKKFRPARPWLPNLPGWCWSCSWRTRTSGSHQSRSIGSLCGAGDLAPAPACRRRSRTCDSNLTWRSAGTRNRGHDPPHDRRRGDGSKTWKPGPCRICRADYPAIAAKPSPRPAAAAAPIPRPADAFAPDCYCDGGGSRRTGLSRQGPGPCLLGRPAAGLAAQRPVRSDRAPFRPLPSHWTSREGQWSVCSWLTVERLQLAYRLAVLSSMKAGSRPWRADLPCSCHILSH